jgi:hypothetical protein
LVNDDKASFEKMRCYRTKNQSTILSAGENIIAIMDLIIKFASMLSKSDGTVFIYI